MPTPTFRTHRCGSLISRLAVALAMLATLAAGRFAGAGQGLPTRANGDETGQWKWWHIVWFHKDGSPRFAHGMTKNTHNHQQRLPVCPPIGDGTFGYHEPCWRQMDVYPRCWSCEAGSLNQSLLPSQTAPEVPPTSMDEEPPTADAPEASPAPAVQPPPPALLQAPRLAP
jgi:hypothetical protein